MIASDMRAVIMELTSKSMHKLSVWFEKAEIFGDLSGLFYGYAFIDQLMVDHGFINPANTIRQIVERKILDTGIGHHARVHIRHSLASILEVYETHQLFEQSRYKYRTARAEQMAIA